MRDIERRLLPDAYRFIARAQEKHEKGTQYESNKLDQMKRVAKVFGGVAKAWSSTNEVAIYHLPDQISQDYAGDSYVRLKIEMSAKQWEACAPAIKKAMKGKKK